MARCARAVFTVLDDDLTLVSAEAASMWVRSKDMRAGGRDSGSVSETLGWVGRYWRRVLTSSWQSPQERYLVHTRDSIEQGNVQSTPRAEILFYAEAPLAPAHGTTGGP